MEPRAPTLFQPLLLFLVVLPEPFWGGGGLCFSSSTRGGVMHLRPSGLVSSPLRSLVLVATRGRPEGLPQFASHLVSLGFAKTADLSSKGWLKWPPARGQRGVLLTSSSHPAAECVAVWAFRGAAPPPPWVWLQTGRGDDPPGLLERYVPVNLEAYGCTPRAAAPPRRDLELLRTATAAD